MTGNRVGPADGPDRAVRALLADGGADPRVGAFDAVCAPLLLVDAHGRVLAVNAAGAELAGADPGELTGASMWQILCGATGEAHRSADGGAEAGEALRPAALVAATSGGDGPQRGRERPVIGEVLWAGPLGDRRRFVWTFTQLSPSQPDRLVGVGVDVTEHRRNEAVWRRRAQTDPLTGLANRVMIERVLAEHLDPARGLGCGLLFCDLDGFKQINDTHGHPAGDQVLVRTGERLTASVREGDLVARLGGDEFVILLPGAGAIETQAVATRVERTISRPVRLDVAAVRVGISVGQRVAQVGEDPEAVLREADTAMYAVKSRRGRRAA